MIGKFVLVHKLCPGDETCATALIRDLKRTYGDQILLDFRNNAEAIRAHNPYLSELSESDPEVQTVRLDYQQGITSAGRGNRHHFLTWFYRDFQQKTGIAVDCLESKPDLHLDEERKYLRPVSGRYWLVIAGGKTDYTIKHWDYSWYQEVVDRLRPYGIRFVQTGLRRPGKPAHIQPKLQRVLDLVNWGGVAELLWLIWHADGVLCPVTAAMHIAAAFQKPCVVLAGGREEWWWEAYTNDGQFGPKASPISVPHRYLHTIGLLDCCRTKGCWLHKIVRIDSDLRICRRPADRQPYQQPLPLCMEMITVEHCLEAIWSYYEERFLAPPELSYAEAKQWNETPQPSERWKECKPIAGQPQPLPPPPGKDLSERADPVLLDRRVSWYTGPETHIPIFQAPEKSRPPAVVESAPIEVRSVRFPERVSAVLGGPLTICLFLRGTETDLHRRSIDGFLKTVPEELRNLHILASGEVPAESRRYAASAGRLHEGPSWWTRYQAYRYFLYENRQEVKGRFVVWSDDDCWPIVPEWLAMFADTACRQATCPVGCWGQRMYHVLQFSRRTDPRLWFRQASWYRNRLFRLRSGAPAPNGDTIHYISGRFCIFRTEAIYASEIPDPRVQHWGGDIVAGEQLYQNGWEIAPFNQPARLVYIGEEALSRQRDAPRVLDFPWY